MVRPIWISSLVAALAALSPAAAAAAAAGGRAVVPAVRAKAPRVAGLPHSRLVFNDEFTGSTLSSEWNTYITSRAASGWPWNADAQGGSSPANPGIDYDEEYFEPSQVSVTGDGLVIRAARRPVEGVLGDDPHAYQWRSGVVTTYGKFQFDGGYLQIEARMPSSPGMWPGLWLLPGPGGSAGDNAEIDLFEGGYVGDGVAPGQTDAWHLHTSSGVIGGTVAVPADVSAGFHTYGLRWVPGQELVWYFDGKSIASTSGPQVPNEPMELILDLQVADPGTAGWHSQVTASTPRLARMIVRGVQVYQ